LLYVKRSINLSVIPDIFLGIDQFAQQEQEQHIAYQCFSGGFPQEQPIDYQQLPLQVFFYRDSCDLLRKFPRHDLPPLSVTSTDGSTFRLRAFVSDKPEKKRTFVRFDTSQNFFQAKL
jgi:hypothetical protein